MPLTARTSIKISPKNNKENKLKNFYYPKSAQANNIHGETNQNERIILFGGNTHIRPIISSKAKKAKGKIGKRWRKQNWGTRKE